MFKHNPLFKEKYIWPKGKLPSPSRVLDETSDKTFLEKWRKKVGEKEADRIVAYSIAIGKSMHTYLEKKINNEEGKLLRKNDPNKAIATTLGNIIIKKGLKEKLEEVWGLEAHLHFNNNYRGIADLIGIYEGESTVIDFKQKRSYQRESYDSVQNYFTQLAAYGLAHNKMCGTTIKKGVLLIVTHDRQFQRFIIKGHKWRYHCLDFIKRLKHCIKERSKNEM